MVSRSAGVKYQERDSAEKSVAINSWLKTGQSCLSIHYTIVYLSFSFCVIKVCLKSHRLLLDAVDDFVSCLLRFERRMFASSSRMTFSLSITRDRSFSVERQLYSCSGRTRDERILKKSRIQWTSRGHDMREYQGKQALEKRKRSPLFRMRTFNDRINVEEDHSHRMSS